MASRRTVTGIPATQRWMRARSEASSRISSKPSAGARRHDRTGQRIVPRLASRRDPLAAHLRTPLSEPVANPTRGTAIAIDEDAPTPTPVAAVLARLPAIQAQVQEARRRAELGECITPAQLARQLAELDAWLGDLAVAVTQRRNPGSRAGR